MTRRVPRTLSHATVNPRQPRLTVSLFLSASSILSYNLCIVGLTLGQALKQKNIPFQIYERDATPSARGQGWAITLHWALPYLHKLLPADVLAGVSDVQVDPEIAKNDNGNFLFINLANGDPKWKIPPSARWRVNREKMRLALTRGIEGDIHWGRRAVGVNLEEEDKAKLVLEDGSIVSGKMVVGIEGSRSMVRQMLCPDTYDNQQLPIRFTGVAVDLTEDEIKPLRAMDPLLFQGCHPDTGDYFWFSMLDTPEVNGSRGTANEKYRAQINMSWRVHGSEDEVSPTDAGRLENMKRRAQVFVPFLRDTIHAIPDGTPVMEIKLADWECLDWDNRGGRVSLAGDAAHAMTMYRGEAANHGLLDAFWLTNAIERVYSGQTDLKTAIDEYEKEMRTRTQQAVRLSSQACRDAHDWDRLNESSAILARRAAQL